MSPIQSTTGPSSMAELKKVLPELSHPDGAPVRVLVVDDEPMIADLLSMGFTLCGWEVIVAHDGATAVELGTAGRPDLAILDVMLPDMDGLDVLERLRAHWSEMPAMFLTAKDATEDRVAGLAAGGDDYVTKPFSMEEVLIRAHRLVQRSGVVSGGSEVLVVGDLVMNTRTHEVTRGGDEIELTATQYNLLKFLVTADEDLELDEKSAKKNLKDTAIEPLDAGIAALEAVEEWTTPNIEAALNKALIDDLGLKPRVAFGALRVGATGAAVSPPLFESMELLGRESTLKRLRAAREVTPYQAAE